MISRKMGVLLIGALGSVATAAVAGTLAVRRKLSPPTGLVTESVTVEGVPLAPLENIYFAGWDIRDGSILSATLDNRVVPEKMLPPLREELKGVRVFPGIRVNLDSVTRQVYGIGADGREESLPEAVDRLTKDISRFRIENDLTSVVAVNVSFTEPPADPELFQWDLPLFEKGIQNSDQRITSSMIYTYAALNSGCGFVNFTPSACAELPALQELADKKGVPVAGKDGKTGQTLYKTVLASMFKARELRIKGWYSTNILGNSDGAILRDELHGKSKMETKSSVLKNILEYDDFEHLVRIDYYSPRGDNKEAWDNIDFEGWLGIRMSMKINWIGCDSALAAPLVVDLARLVELALNRGEKGSLIHLGLFFKSPYNDGPAVKGGFYKEWSLFQEYIKSCKNG